MNPSTTPLLFITIFSSIMQWTVYGDPNPSVVDIYSLLDIHPNMYTSRHLEEEEEEEWVIPNYTSPATEDAILATPLRWRDDEYVKAARNADAEDQCLSLNASQCQILFPPPPDVLESGSAKVGVLFYGGGLVDPRAYSPIAKVLSKRYGFAVAIPIFDADIAFKFGSCDTGRIHLAIQAFPEVEKWILAGHSMGGIGAQTDLFTAISQNSTIANRLGGLVLVASYIREVQDCDLADFSQSSMPTALVTGSLDYIVNATNMNDGMRFLPINNTFYMNILGANHGNFGSYDYSERKAVLGQVDGNATAPKDFQLELTIDAIRHVAYQMGVPVLSRYSLLEADEKESNSSGYSAFHNTKLVFFVICIAAINTLSFFIFL